MCEYNIIRNDVIYCTINNKPCPASTLINSNAYVKSDGCPKCKNSGSFKKWWKG
jgi:hypothetical protein